jgi:adenosylcobinamide-phosphate synthase
MSGPAATGRGHTDRVGAVRAQTRRRRLAVLAAAAAIDLALGDPPNRLHPVAWLGQAVTALERTAPRQGRGRQLLWGAVVAAALPVVAALAGGAAARAVRPLGMAGVLLEATLFKLSFSVRGLLLAGEAVRRPLAAGDLAAARTSLRSLVSRPTADLPAALIAAAAVESLAENVTDGFLAPWLAYALGGLPAAFAYRAANTLDSMLGYRGRYEYLGKAPARLDDALNLAPARLAAALLVLASPAGGGGPVRALRGALRDHRRTASPNAGWTMAAMAGALGVRLEKRGAYVLGAGREPHAGDIRRAQHIVAAAAALGLAAVGALAGWADAVRGAHPARERR